MTSTRNEARVRWCVRVRAETVTWLVTQQQFDILHRLNINIMTLSKKKNRIQYRSDDLEIINFVSRFGS